MDFSIVKYDAIRNLEKYVLETSTAGSAALLDFYFRLVQMVYVTRGLKSVKSINQQISYQYSSQRVFVLTVKINDPCIESYLHQSY